MNWLQGSRWFSWSRMAGVTVTGGLFYGILQKINTEQLWVTVRSMHVGWFAVAMALFGVSLWLGAIRWHLALRLTESNVHFGASCRLLFIGHFCYVALFGAAGGDVAKSVIYSRWYRLSLPEVIAAAPLDRGLGLVGTVLIFLVAGAVTMGNGGFAWPGDLSLAQFQTWWLLIIVGGLVLALILMRWRPAGDSPWKRGLQAISAGAARLVRSRVLGRQSLVVALVHQAANCAVFGVSLQAVASNPLPWGQLMWTAPAVTALSCFPITIAGAGVREISAMALLGLYGIPASDAVAAAMITLAVKLAWSGLGGLVFWREEYLQTKHRGRVLPRTLSIVIPVHDEERALPETLKRLRQIPEIMEIIVVDGGSRDRTVALAEEAGCQVIRHGQGRGPQLRAGARRARGDVVVLLHADTWLPPTAGRAMLGCLRDATVVGGGFWKTFRDAPLFLRGARLKCVMRLWIWNRIAADQAIFVRRSVLEAIGGVPDLPLMEEFVLCDRLAKQGRLALAGATLQTSARRFRRFGVLRTYLLMGWIHLRFRLGTSPEILRRIYERG